MVPTGIGFSLSTRPESRRSSPLDSSFKNYLFLIITEFELAVVTRKKDLLPFAPGQRPAATKKTLE